MTLPALLKINTRLKVVVFFIGTISVIVLVLWTLTGGVMQINEVVILPEYKSVESRPVITCEITPTRYVTGTKHVFERVNYASPLSVEITYITHELVTEPTLLIDAFFIEFPDGRIVSPANLSGLQMALIKDEHIYIDDSGVRQTRQCQLATAKVPQLAFGIEDFKIRLKLILYSQGVHQRTDERVIKFKVFTSSRLISRWHWLAAD